MRTITRRSVLAAPLALPLPATSAPAPGGGGIQRFTLETGQNAPRGGPAATLTDGSLLWATTEPEPPYLAKAMWPISRIAIRRSTDGGCCWSEPRVAVQGTPEYSVLSHALRLTRSGTLLHIFVRYGGYDYETGSPLKSLCEVFFHRSSDGGVTWSEPEKMPTGERYNGDVLSLAQLRDGRLIYPFAFLTATKARFAVSVMYSDDDGQKWKRSRSILEAGGGGFESGANEPSVVQLPDGRLWMLIRAQTGFQWQSFSKDGGVTWSTAEPSALPSSNAPATMLKLRSGEIAVAWNNDVHSNYARQSLVLGITADGVAFRGMREVDFTDFPDNPSEPVHHVTYPYLSEARDGTIVMSYNKGTWMRHNYPTLARVSPNWITARAELIDFHEGRTGWHTVNPGPDHRAAVERYVRADGGLWLELQQSPGSARPAGITRGIPLVAEGKVEAEVHVERAEGYVLFGDTLLEPGALEEACVRIRCGNGTVYVGAGTPQRVQRSRRSTEYGYLAHLVTSEAPYPRMTETGPLHIAVAYSTARQESSVRLNNGPAVTLRTGRILGLACFGLAVAKGGRLRVQSIQTTVG
jgi:hypothetical protein